jgi:DNA polymerase/3'-5' exonuclease PolX
MYPGDITDPAQLKGMKGIGTTIYQKLVDFQANGTLRVIDENKELIEKKHVMNVFADIYGVGEKKAEELIDAGITTIEELETRQSELLNAKQRVGLKYYNDILQRIPRTEIQEYEVIFKEAFPKVPDASFEIVGSYRRGMANSGDIDVIITSSDACVFRVFVDELVQMGIIVEILSRGEHKCLVIAKLPNAQYARRVDFLYAIPKEYPFSILYFTGSKEFNTTMRERALSMNYTMNEHGLSDKKSGERVAQLFPDEKSIFELLGMEFKQPMERINGNAVVSIDGTTLTKANSTQKVKTVKKAKSTKKAKPVLDDAKPEPTLKPTKKPEPEP